MKYIDLQQFCILGLKLNFTNIFLLMITAFALVLTSLAILYFGADWLVKGSSSLAIRLGVAPLIVGLTVVAFGTSTPELIVSITAALSGTPEITVGNVVGSNIFNIGIILGLSAMIYPLRVHRQILRLDMPIAVLAALIFTILFWNGNFGRIEGACFLICIVVYTWYIVNQSKKEKKKADSQDDAGSYKTYKHWYIDAGLILLGLGVLALGSDMLVKNAVIIAQNFGISEAVIGLTIVAAGTSMPELATSVVAALKKNNDIAIGNIVGSNIYNLLAIMGISSLIKPIHAPEVNYIDNLVMLGFTLLLLPLMQTGYTIKRKEGILLFILYAVYLCYLIF